MPLPMGTFSKGRVIYTISRKSSVLAHTVITFKPLPKQRCRFSLVECKNRREEGGNVMLCKQILYLKGNKKSTKTAVKYLHLWRFRQNIKSSCTVKSPVLFLSILSSLPPSVCPLQMLISALRAADTETNYPQSDRDGAGVWLAGHPRMAKDHPCGRGYTSHAGTLCEIRSCS